MLRGRRWAVCVAQYLRSADIRRGMDRRHGCPFEHNLGPGGWQSVVFSSCNFGGKGLCFRSYTAIRGGVLTLKLPTRSLLFTRLVDSAFCESARNTTLETCDTCGPWTRGSKVLGFPDSREGGLRQDVPNFVGAILKPAVK